MAYIHDGILFSLAMEGNHLQCWGMETMAVCILGKYFTLEVHHSPQRKEILACVTTWNKLEDIVLSEIKQSADCFMGDFMYTEYLA